MLHFKRFMGYVCGYTRGLMPVAFPKECTPLWMQMNYNGSYNHNHEKAKFSTFLKSVNSEDSYFFILKNRDLPVFDFMCKTHGINRDDIVHYQSSHAAVNKGEPKGPDLNVLILRFPKNFTFEASSEE